MKNTETTCEQNKNIRKLWVVFTTKKLTAFKCLPYRKYYFICDNQMVKEGDIITSSDYKTPIQIVKIYPYFGNSSKFIKIDTINGVDVNELSSQNISKCISQKENKLSVFNRILEKYKLQFVPIKDESIKIALDGNICVFVNDNYIGIDKTNNLIRYPTEMCIDIPIYLLFKQYTQIKEGDIIKTNDSYVKVLHKNSDGSLDCLSFTGYNQTRREIKDFILNKSFVKVIVNIFEEVNNINPLIFAIISKKISIKDALLLQIINNSRNVLI